MTYRKGRNRQRWGYLVLAVLAVVLIVGGGVWLAFNTPIAYTPAPQPTNTQLPTEVQTTSNPPATTTQVALPASLQIPAIGVNHALTTVDLNADGTMQVPPLAQVAVPAWYDKSPKPGANGPAVIVGHVDSAAQGAGVFYKLGALKNGDTIGITRADGSVVTFHVYDVVSVAKASFPTEAVYGNTATPELRIITCGGQFDRTTGHYLNNTIVFAKV